MHKSDRFQRLLVFLLALISAGTVHLLNRHQLGIVYADGLRAGITVRTADDASYISPAENYLNTGEWKDSSPGIAGKVQRSPGYGLIYLVFRSLLSQNGALWALISLQLLLFALAASLVSPLARSVGIHFIAAFILGIGVAFLPIFSGFLLYTLTEGLIPSLVIFFLYCSLHSSGRNRWFLAASALLGFMLLVRPPMLVWIISLFPVLFLQRSIRVQSVKPILAGGLLALLPLFIWQIHVTQVAGHFIGLHPIYHVDSPGLYRPLHATVWDFHKTWGQDGTTFHKTINGLWNAAMKDGEKEIAVKGVIDYTDARVLAIIPEDSLYAAYTDYMEIMRNQKPYVESGQPFPFGESPRELRLKKKIQSYRTRYQKAFPLHAHIGVPLQVYGNMAFHSNLSLYIFQKTYRGNWFIEALRYISFALHSSVFLIFPFAAIWFWREPKWLAISLPVAIYLFYLAYVQRGIEERYTLPVLVPMLLLAVAAVISWYATALKFWQLRFIKT